MLNDIEHLNSNMNRSTALQRTYLVSGDIKDIAPLADLRTNARAVLGKLTDAVKDNPDQKGRLKEFKTLLKQRSGLVDQLFTIRRSQGFDASKAFFDSGNDSRLFEAMQLELDGIKSEAAQELSSQSASEASVRGRIVWTEALTTLMVFSLLTGIGLVLDKIHPEKCADRHSPGGRNRS